MYPDNITENRVYTTSLREHAYPIPPESIVAWGLLLGILFTHAAAQGEFISPPCVLLYSLQYVLQQNMKVK